MDWRSCALLGSAYEVSSDGQVRSLRSRFGPRAVPRLLRPFTDRYGYTIYTVMKDGRPVHVPAHRAVLFAFAGAPKAGAQANHKNGVRSDNRARNLEWVSAKENIRHSYAVLNRQPNSYWQGKSGAAHARSRAVVQYAQNGRRVNTFGSLAEAGRAGFSSICIARVCRGSNKHHKGFVWAFEDQT